MALLNIAALKELLPTDLPDTALQLLLDAAESDITRRCGNLGSVTERLEGGGPAVFLSRPAASISEIGERLDRWTEYETLQSSDYRIGPDGRSVYRKGSTLLGGAPAWGWEVTVTYVPQDVDGETARRKLAQRDLVQLSLQYDALNSIKDGELTLNHLDYTLERSKILQRLAVGSGRLAA